MKTSSKYKYQNTHGNYYSFVVPPKPKGVENKKAFIVGSGIAGLSAAFFLIRDGQMEGNKIEIFEETNHLGGALDGYSIPGSGFVMRGGRELEDHYECSWDMFRSIPSPVDPKISVLDEFYRLNLKDPNFSYCRLLGTPGHRKKDDGKYGLSKKDINEITKLIMRTEKSLDNVKIEDVFSPEFFKTNFWYYWASMFAFETWHSAMEMRRYLMRFIHHIDGLPDLSALKFTKFNQYVSFVLPLKAWLTKNGVKFHKDTNVTNVIMKKTSEEEDGHRKKIAKKIVLQDDKGKVEEIALTPNDLVFITNGSITESTTYGSDKTPAVPNWNLGWSWKLWLNLAEQDSDFGKPRKFFENVPDRAWHMSATMMIPKGPIIDQLEKISKRDPFAGNTVTGGIVTPVNSKWGLSYTINRQPQFADQPKDKIALWIYALYSDTEGDYIHKKPTECTGNEIAQETLYQMGIPVSKIEEYAATCDTVPCYMPYVTSYFQIRQEGDRPQVLPAGTVNVAFLGNFAEIKNDTVFTMEYSVRTAMSAVYGFLGVERGVPEVFPAIYDARYLLRALYYMNDKKPLTSSSLSWIEKRGLKLLLRKTKNTFIEELLVENKLVSGK